MLKSIPLSVSRAHNVKYGEIDAHRLLIEAAVRGASPAERAASARARNKNVPTPEWHRCVIRRTCEGDIGKTLDDNIRQQIVDLQRLGCMPRRPTIAFDKTTIARYGNVSELPRGKAKDGTTHFETYFTAQIVDYHTKLTICVIPVKKGDKNVDLVRKMFYIFKEFGINPRLFLGDREFFSVDVIRAFDELGYKYLMPCRATPGVRNAIKEYDSGSRKRISSTVIKNNIHQEKYHIIINPHRNDPDEHQAFATNNPKVDIEKYRKRWGIETNYRVAKGMRVKTSSRVEECRIFMFTYTMILLNVWTLFNAILLKDRSSGMMSRGLFLDTIQDFVDKVPPEPPPPTVP